MARKPHAPGKADTPNAAAKSPDVTETQELRARIERLEARMDGSVIGDDGPADLDHGIDRSEAEDPLRKAVARQSRKREARKP